MKYVETHGFETFPLLIRPGAVIPFNPTLKTPEGDFTKDLQILVNGPITGKQEVEVVVPSDVGSIDRTYVIGADQAVDVEVVDLTQRSASLG